MPIISKLSDIDVTSFKFSEPWINKSGGQTVFIKNAFDKKIVFTTPLCKAPFGISTMNNRSSITFNVSNDTERMIEFHTFLSNLDLHVMSTAANCSLNWFKKPLSMDKIAKMYNPCLKNKNEKFEPIFRARFPTNEKGEFEGNIYDMQRNEISKSAITNGCFIEAIVEMTGVYFIANDFGISWKILQLKVKPNNTIRGYAFLEDDSDDNDQSDAEPN